MNTQTVTLDVCTSPELQRELDRINAVIKECAAQAAAARELRAALDAEPEPPNAQPWRRAGLVIGPGHDMRHRVAAAWAAFIAATDPAPDAGNGEWTDA